MVAAAPAWRSIGSLKYVVVPPRLALVAAPLSATTMRPLTSAQARQAMAGRATAVVDGAMFDTCGGPRRTGESQAAFYKRVGCARPNWRAVDVARGIDIPSRRPNDGLTVSVGPDGRTTVANGATVADGAAVAFQLYPPLVRHGAVVPGIGGGSNAETNWRAGVGVTADGQILFAVGRMSIPEFAAALVRAGAVDAGYTDGGGSGRVETSDGRREGSTEDRPVAMWIAGVDPGAPNGVVIPPPPPPNAGPVTDPVPREADAPVDASKGGMVMAAAVVAAILGAVTLWRR